MSTPTPAVLEEELERARRRLSDEVDNLKESGTKYAQSRARFKRGFAVECAMNKSRGESAAASEQQALGELKQEYGDYERDKILWETTKEIVRAKSAECNVIQTQLNARRQEWNQTT